MPAIVRTADDELVEVPTTADVAKAKRFWISIAGIPLLGLLGTALLWGVTQGQKTDDLRHQHTLDSLAVGGFPELAAQVRSNTRALAGITTNLDSSISLSHQILKYVSRKP